MSAGDAPIELYGFHPEYDNIILARRAGEPDFVWVEDLGDAYLAAAVRGVEVVVTAPFYDELLAAADSALELERLRVL